MAEKHELAHNDYIAGMSYKEIAEKYGVKESTIKTWKVRYAWQRDRTAKRRKKQSEKVTTLNTKRKKVVKSSQCDDDEPVELTDQEQIFCYHYVRTFNATQAALLAGYGNGNKASAAVLGCRLLHREHIQKETSRVKALFRQKIHVDILDFLAFCMKIIGADIGDYMKFGSEDRLVRDMDGPVKDPDTGEYLKESVSMVTLRESEQLDTSVITEIKQGKDGISIKLADKKWAWEQIIKYFDWLPDQWKRKVEGEKLELERRKIEALEKKANGPGEEKPIEILIKRKEKRP